VWPDGPTRLTGPGIVYFLVKPKWTRYSDFDQNPPLILAIAFSAPTIFDKSLPEAVRGASVQFPRIRSWLSSRNLLYYRIDGWREVKLEFLVTPSGASRRPRRVSELIIELGGTGAARFGGLGSRDGIDQDRSSAEVGRKQLGRL
jgi:hypothetical protein